MNKAVYPAQGKKFVLTPKGESIPRIAAKYSEEYTHQDYSKSAPESWLRNEYIKEVDE